MRTSWRLLAFVFPCVVWCQAPDTLWTRADGGFGDDEGIGCVDAGNNSTIVTGWDASHGNGGHDVVISRINDSGQRAWVRYFGRSSDDEGYSVVRVGENTFAVGGWTTVSGLGGEFYLVVFDGNGDTLWTRHFGGSGNQKCYDLVKTTKVDGFAMAGYSTAGGSSNVMLLRVSPTGDSLWSRTYGGTGSDVAWSICETFDHGYLLTGYTNSYGHGAEDIYVIRTNAGGDTLWTRTFGGPDLDWAYYSNNGIGSTYLLAGYTVSFRRSGIYNAWFLSISDNGDTLWTKVLPGTSGGTSVGTSIAVMDGGEYFVVGHGNGSGPDAWAAQLSSTRSVIWSKQVGGGSSDYGREGIVKPNNAGYFIAGNTFTYGAGSSDVYTIFLEGSNSRELLVLSPNGGDEWTIGEQEDITWRGRGFAGDVSLELNRDFPGGTWEFLGVFLNDGQETILATGPASDHCRIRASAVADTLVDISDFDFSIVDASPPDTLIVLQPNGSETWPMLSVQTINWLGTGFSGNVRIDLNRSYPTGAWEQLSASTANDGVYAWNVVGPPSNVCRMRVSALSAPLSDVSDTNFSILSSAGYLALVRASEPGIAVLSWNAGVVECPQTVTAHFRLKNFGLAPLSVSRGLEPSSPSYSLETNCPGTMSLNAGQMSACTITLTFDPAIDGVLRDTLLIPTDAVNAVGGYVRVALEGRRFSTPNSPTITINARGDDIRLRWRRVTTTTGGCAISSPQYYVYVADQASGPYVFHTATADTFCIHGGIGNFAARKFYHVTAVTAP